MGLKNPTGDTYSTIARTDSSKNFEFPIDVAVEQRTRDFKLNLSLYLKLVMDTKFPFTEMQEMADLTTKKAYVESLEARVRGYRIAVLLASNETEVFFLWDAKDIYDKFRSYDESTSPSSQPHWAHTSPQLVHTPLFLLARSMDF